MLKNINEFLIFLPSQFEMDDPRVRSAISALGGEASKNDELETTDVRQLIHARDDHLFLWNRSASNVLAVALDRGGREGVDKGDPVQVHPV